VAAINEHEINFCGMLCQGSPIYVGYSRVVRVTTTAPTYIQIFI
jgi:hypothetical protein